jgi:hypothetical protein
MGNAATLARAVSAVLPGIEALEEPNPPLVRWSEIVDQKKELWPIQYLLPGGAYAH